MSVKKTSRKNRRVTGLAGRLCVAAAVLGYAAPGLAQQATDPVQVLIEQSRYWQSRHDTVRAKESWEKLLRIDPTQPDALVGMAELALDDNDVSLAEDYLRQLRSAHPRSSLIRRLEQSIQLAGNRGQLEAARNLAQQGRVEEAVNEYRQAFGGQPPSGELAMEYYQTLGGSADGWEEARRGFERLAQASPNDSSKALALARHLTYRNSTRVEGIRRLSELTKQPAVREDARQAWRQALEWLGGSPADVRLYNAYLASYPDDQGIRQKVAEAGRERQQAQQAQQAAQRVNRDPYRDRTTAGFRLLNQNDLVNAELEFKSVLAARPNDGDAQGGLGLVRLKQKNFEEAQVLLAQASKRGNAGRWKEALDSATYWSLVRGADKARADNRLSEAQRLLTQAVRIDRQEPTGQNNLADVLYIQGDYPAAETLYRNVLKQTPDQPEALRGLITVLPQVGKSEEAMQLVARLTPEQQEGMGNLGALRAEEAMRQARLALQQNDVQSGKVALERAIANDPTNPWIRLELARLYMDIGQAEQAQGLMQALLSSGTPTADALHASALFAAAQEDWRTVLQLLERVPGNARNTDLANLHKRAWIHEQSKRALALAGQGQQQQAEQLLSELRGVAGRDTELLGVVASAYADVGQPTVATELLRQSIVGSVAPSPGLWLQYAAVLLKTGQDAELAGILQQLSSQPLSRADQASFKSLRDAYVVRQADALRLSGDLAGAYDVLQPLLQEPSVSKDARSALARMYSDNGDYNDALAIYKDELEINAADVPTLLAVTMVAEQAKDYRYAESALKNALKQAPDDYEVLSTAARYYRARGKNSQAVKYYDQAVAAQRRGNVGAASGNRFAGTQGAAGGNPFRRGGAATAMAVPAPVNNQAARAGTAPAFQAVPYAAGAAYIPPPVQAGGAVAGSTGWNYAGGGQAQVVAPAATRTAAATGSRSLPANAAVARPAQAARTAQATPQMPAAQAMAGAYGAYGNNYASAGQPQDSGWQYDESMDGIPVAPQRPRSLNEEFADLKQERTPTIAMGVNTRQRDGEKGLGKMDEYSVPIEASMPLGDGKISVHAMMVSIDAGTPETARSLATYDASSRFGGGPQAAYESYLVAESGGRPVSPGSQSQEGVGLALKYENDYLRADVGTTPLGFQENNIVGGVSIQGPLGDKFAYKATASRRPVTDSVLSYAGTKDERTGDKWGGVVATGGRVDLTYEPEPGYGFYGYGSYHYLTGHNVASNTRIEGGGGMYVHLMDEEDARLTTGVNVTGMGYGKNRRFFTYGHGGYFSPQNFVSVSVPIDWSQRKGRLSYRVAGSIGLQHFKEDPANYFPTSSSRQMAAYEAAQNMASLADLNDDAARARYAGQSKTGVGYNFSGAMEYQVAPQLFFGGHLGLDNAKDYRQFTGGLYLRYAFEPQSRPLAMPVQQLRSIYSD